MRKPEKAKKREFTGKLGDFVSPQERNYFKKALRAYAKGKERFAFGRDVKTGGPKYYPVPQKFVK